MANEDFVSWAGPIAEPGPWCGHDPAPRSELISISDRLVFTLDHETSRVTARQPFDAGYHGFDKHGRLARPFRKIRSLALPS